MLVNFLSMINAIFIYYTQTNKTLYGVSIIFNGNLNTGAFAMIFPHVSRVFGFKYAGDLYAVVVLSTGISTLIGSVILYFIYTTINSCIIVIIIGGALNFFGLFLCSFEDLFEV